MLISGAGSGIGRACAFDLAQTYSDVDLILVGRREGPLEETRKALPRADRHVTVSVSQGDQEALHEKLSALDLPKRNLVAVVANAGVGGENRYGKDDRWNEIIQTNLSGTYYLVNECIPALLASPEKAKNILIVSSILSRLGVPGYAAYCASKAGLLGMMRSMAAAFAKKGVYVNAILPGWVNTEMAREGIQQFADHVGQSYDQALAGQMSMVPTGKMSEPAEIAALVSFVVSGKQTSFTGQCLDMNNGALMP